MTIEREVPSPSLPTRKGGKRPLVEFDMQQFLYNFTLNSTINNYRQQEVAQNLAIRF